MSYTKEHLENLILKAQEEFCDWLFQITSLYPFTCSDMEDWSQANWSDTAKHFSFCFMLKNTGAPCADETLDIFRDSLLDAASDSGYIDF